MLARSCEVASHEVSRWGESMLGSIDDALAKMLTSFLARSLLWASGSELNRKLHTGRQEKSRTHEIASKRCNPAHPSTGDSHLSNTQRAAQRTSDSDLVA